jgi:hypothetical protein
MSPVPMGRRGGAALHPDLHAWYVFLAALDVALTWSLSTPAASS